MNTTYCLEHGWIEGEWRDDVEVQIGPNDRIESVTVGLPESTGERIVGWTMPGIPNVHSHAFQWAMAGRSEFRTRDRDSFWSWREQMYESLKDLGPGEYYERARGLYRRMRMAGYTSVGEFHYVHVQANGRPYGDLGAMSEAVIAAALEEGLAICILPVLYQRGGFDGRPLVGAQIKFGLSDDQFLEVCGDLGQRYGDHPHVTVGMAFHSLRAVDVEKLSSITAEFERRCGPGPIHIHVAEQTGEVDESLEASGCRPVELLFRSVDVDARWCLIHATHLTDSEIGMIAESGATVGLCPTTEANLGDGIFRAGAFVANGGRLAIGSDSHVGTDPFSEMRMIEYGQRLSTRRRAILCNPEQSCGEFLYSSVIENGNRVVGRSGGQIAVGRTADWIVLDSLALRQGFLEDDASLGQVLLDRAVFCEFGTIIKSTLACGRWVESR